MMRFLKRVFWLSMMVGIGAILLYRGIGVGRELFGADGPIGGLPGELFRTDAGDTTEPAAVPTMIEREAVSLPTLDPIVQREGALMDVTAFDAALATTGEGIDGSAIDGNGVWVQIEVQAPDGTSLEGAVELDAPEAGPSDSAPERRCEISAPQGGTGRCTVSLPTDGWAWKGGARIGSRAIVARFEGRDDAGEPVEILDVAEVSVSAAPIILVHGFVSNAFTWATWLRPDGYLAPFELDGHAVGDGFGGTEAMRTGDSTKPREAGNTIAQNAEILSDYVGAVRRASGAERVDIVAHSMGGLISRHYIDHLMPVEASRGVAARPAVRRLVMVGTPNGGTSCAIPLAASGMLAPMSYELTPDYVRGWVNRWSDDPKGVPFTVLAGDPVSDFAAMVCTGLPTDSVVAVESALGSIPVHGDLIAARHIEQTASPVVFARVMQELSKGSEEFPLAMPPDLQPGAPGAPGPDDHLQISILDSGTLPADSTARIAVDLPAAEAASIVLYGPGAGLGLAIEAVPGAPSPGAIDADPGDEGGGGLGTSDGAVLESASSASAEIVISPTEGKLSAGGDYVVAAFMRSDIRLEVDWIPGDEPTMAAVQANLLGPIDLSPEATTIKATWRDEAGRILMEDVLRPSYSPVTGDGVGYSQLWDKPGPGVYAIIIEARGRTASGRPFTRVAVLAREVIDWDAVEAP